MDEEEDTGSRIIYHSIVGGVVWNNTNGFCLSKDSETGVSERFMIHKMEVL